MRAFLVSAVLASSLLGGCASGDDDAAPVEPPSSASSESSSSESSSVPASPTPSPSTGVAPATGPELKLSGATLRIPEGWAPDPTNTQDILVATGKFGLTYESFGVVALPGCCSPLNQQVKQIVDLTGGTVRLDRKPDASLDGSPAYHLVGADKVVKGVWHVSIGGGHLDHNYTLSFELKNPSRAKRDALVDSVLASWQWE